MEKKEFISKNIECNWTIKNKVLTSKKNDNYNIISVVYFNYKNVERYQSKDEINKKYLKYYNGLLNIIKNFRKVFNNEFILRIYYDDSVEENINKILEQTNNEFNKYIELFKYDIPLFKEDGQHKKTVGTLIRFLPLFDYKLHKVNKCIVFDIDNKLYNYYKNIINFFNENKVKLSYRTKSCYFMNKRIKCISKDLYYGIVASFIYTIISVDKKIFEEFLEDTFITKTNYKIITDDCGLKDEYEYGIDEIFLNSSYIQYFLKNKISIFPILYNYTDISGVFCKFLKINDNISNKNLNIFKNFVVIFYKIFNLTIEINNKKDLNNIKDELKKTAHTLNNKIDYKLKKSKYNRKELYRFLIKSVETINMKDFKLLIDCIFKNLKLNLNKINIHEFNTNTKYVKYHHIDFKFQ
jgi:hypothetical protein